jgi:hypothetical protein
MGEAARIAARGHDAAENLRAVEAVLLEVAAQRAAP